MIYFLGHLKCPFSIKSSIILWAFARAAFRRFNHRRAFFIALIIVHLRFSALFFLLRHFTVRIFKELVYVGNITYF